MSGDSLQIHTSPEGFPATPRYRRWTPLDLVLFLEALHTGSYAQRIRRLPLDQVTRSISQKRLPLKTHDIQRARTAAIRAIATGARYLGWLDTCLTRALTTAGLISPRECVTLHLGFRPGTGLPIDGHAWLMVGSEPLELVRMAHGAGRQFITVYQLIVHSPETEDA